MKLDVNGTVREVAATPDMPLLWAIREVVGLHGTKFGCGIAQCGACTVHIEGQATRSCVLPVAQVQGRRVVTIEALGTADAPHPLQRAWIAEQVPQCGYCQSGQIMQAASLLSKNPDPTKAEIVAHMDGNLCRCMTYGRIQKAIIRAAADMRAKSGS